MFTVCNDSVLIYPERNTRISTGEAGLFVIKRRAARQVPGDSETLEQGRE
jgi:hypothetical protein